MFVIIATFSMGASGSPRLDLALIAAVPLGAVAAYLCATYWPRAERARPSDADRGQAQVAPQIAEITSPVEPEPAEGD